MKSINRLCALLLAVITIFSVFSVLTVTASAATTVTIGHASISENNTINGAPGDSTGKEVCTRDWYNKPWIAVIRPKDATHAEKIAKAMEQACANNNIGYGQSDRTTLYTQAKAKNWDLSKITVKCNADCSSLVAVCVNAAGITVSKDMYTGNEQSVLNATGKFTIYTSSAYISSSTNLKRGDILLGSGHTAIVLSNGSGSTASSSGSTSAVYYPACSSSYTSIVDALKSIGVDNSLANRKLIAAANGISGYSGTAAQNTQMLNLLKQGKLKKVGTTTSSGVSYYPKCSSSYTSIVDGLKSIGVDSSLANRKVIAAKNGISNYTGTAAQNTQLLNLLKAGTLKRP